MQMENRVPAARSYELGVHRSFCYVEKRVWVYNSSNNKEYALGIVVLGTESMTGSDQGIWLALGKPAFFKRVRINAPKNYFTSKLLASKFSLLQLQRNVRGEDVWEEEKEVSRFVDHKGDQCITTYLEKKAGLVHLPCELECWVEIITKITEMFQLEI